MPNSTIASQLFNQIKRASEGYGKPASHFSAKVELLPEYHGDHYLMAEVTYLRGDLSSKTKPRKKK